MCANVWDDLRCSVRISIADLQMIGHLFNDVFARLFATFQFTVFQAVSVADLVRLCLTWLKATKTYFQDRKNKLELKTVPMWHLLLWFSVTWHGGQLGL